MAFEFKRVFAPSWMCDWRWQSILLGQAEHGGHEERVPSSSEKACCPGWAWQSFCLCRVSPTGSTSHHLYCFFVFLFVSTKEMRRKASPWQRNLGYPLAMLMLLALTVHTEQYHNHWFYINSSLCDIMWACCLCLQVMCVLMVCFNVLELLLDEKAMPRGMEVRFPFEGAVNLTETDSQQFTARTVMFVL